MEEPKVSVKMLIQGSYGGQSFKVGDVVEFSEEALKGLDAQNYEVVEASEKKKGKKE
mgnify:CR=1 FL=1